MRRAVLAAIWLLGMTTNARAEPWAVAMESGAEADSNVGRVETVDGGTTKRIAAPAARAGARVGYHLRLFDGFLAVGVSGLARMVASSKARDENVMLYIGESRWLQPLGTRPLAVGLHLVAADAFAIRGGTGARTFRNLGADAMLQVGREDRHLTLEIGGRDFWYKPRPPNLPAHLFDWRGPVANARLDLLLWQTLDKTRSLELATILGFEARSYSSNAMANCAADGASDPCTMATTLRRRDRYQRAGLELRWTGHVVATGSYQATLIDSNSFGQSLIRQRLKGALTMELPGKLFGTATATLQLDEYPDGILIEKDVVKPEFTSLEDENRSSLQILVTRALSTTWSVEARAAAWRDFANTGEASFRRELIYAGVIYAR